MQRRTLLKRAARLAAMVPAAGAAPVFEQQELRPPPSTGERLDQGPFDIDQDRGWLTLLSTTPSEKPQRNPGLGLVGYTWEESGPSLAVRAGRDTLERHGCASPSDTASDPPGSGNASAMAAPK
jgi:hypothetical protein